MTNNLKALDVEQLNYLLVDMILFVSKVTKLSFKSRKKYILNCSTDFKLKLMSFFLCILCFLFINCSFSQY